MLHSLSKCVDKLNKAIANLEKHFKCEALQAHTGITYTLLNQVVQDQSCSIETVVVVLVVMIDGQITALAETMLQCYNESESVKLLAINPPPLLTTSQD